MPALNPAAQKDFRFCYVQRFALRDEDSDRTIHDQHYT